MKSPNQVLLRSLLVRPVLEYDRRIVFHLYGHMFDFLIKGIGQYYNNVVNSTATAGTGGAAMKVIINTEVAGKVLFSLDMLHMDELWPTVKQFLPGTDESSQPVDGGFNPLPGPPGSSDPTFFGAVGVDILDRDQLPSSPGDPRALPSILDFIDNEERARIIREAWEDAHSSGKVHPVLSEDFVWTIVELERRIERELRRDFSDDSVLRNYASWQEISIKNAPPYCMKGRLFMRKDTYKERRDCIDSLSEQSRVKDSPEFNVSFSRGDALSLGGKKSGRISFLLGHMTINLLVEKKSANLSAMLSASITLVYRVYDVVYGSSRSLIRLKGETFTLNRRISARSSPGVRMLPKVRAFPARAVKFVLNDRMNVSGCESSPTENRAAG
ncbi:hypothetical protein AgCh_028247 [Apium graveolens]